MKILCTPGEFVRSLAVVTAQRFAVGVVTYAALRLWERWRACPDCTEEAFEERRLRLVRPSGIDPQFGAHPN